MKVISSVPGNTEMKLSRAIFVYETNTTSAGIHGATRGHRDKRMVLQYDAFEDGTLGNSPELLRRDDFVSLINCLGMPGEAEFLPPNVLAIDGDLMLWFVPSAKRKIYIKKDRSKNPTEWCVNHPPLVFKAMGNSNGQKGMLNVWCVTTNRRPTPTTPLYNAPYPQITNGSVHLCGANPPSSARVKDMAQWERVFFESLWMSEQVQGLKGITFPKLLEHLKENKPDAAFLRKHLRKSDYKTIGGII